MSSEAHALLDKFDVGDEIEIRFDDKVWYAADLTMVPSDEDSGGRYHVTFHVDGTVWDFVESEACRGA